MVEVLVDIKGREDISSDEIVRKVTSLVEDKLGKIDAVVDVSIVDEDTISELAKKYMGDSEEESREHPVLSFVDDEIEKEFVFPPDGKKHIGSVMVKEVENVDEIYEWIEHGVKHLLGEHHD
jgi:hypothetical protein